MAADLYEVLGVAHDASAEEIKRAYRALARQHHPDANQGDAAAEARFKEISQAYEILSDPERRANYDRFGADVGAGSPFGAASVQDIFDMFFSGFSPFGGGGRRGPQPGPDAEVQVSLTLDEAAFGVERQVSVTLPQRCATCGGSGCSPGTSPVPCTECQGSGEVRRVRSSFLGQMVTSTPCARCGATGQRIETPCKECRGDGRVTATSTLTVSIPAGVEDGSTMRLADRGPAGPRGGPNGRLFVRLGVAPDPRFERVGDDLHHEARVAFTQAALGATIEVPTLEGTASVDVEAGSANGTVHRIRYEGVPHLHGRGRGDLYVHLAVDVPTSLDDESAGLLRQLAAHRGEAVREPGGRLFARRGAKK